MNTIKKFAAIKLTTQRVNDNATVQLSYGQIYQNYGYTHTPDEEFDTEYAAEVYAYNEDKYAKWMIVPIIRFEY